MLNGRQGRVLIALPVYVPHVTTTSQYARKEHNVVALSYPSWASLPPFGLTDHRAGKVTLARV